MAVNHDVSSCSGALDSGNEFLEAWGSATRKIDDRKLIENYCASSDDGALITLVRRLVVQNCAAEN